MSARRAAVLCVVVLGGSICRPAHASGGTVQAYEAPSECPDESAFGAE